MSENDACHVEVVEKMFDRAALQTAMVAYLQVGGMGCPNCALRVRNGLLNLDGVLLTEVILEDALAMVAFDPQQTTPEALTQAVAAAGNDGRHHYSAQFLQQEPAKQALRI